MPPGRAGDPTFSSDPSHRPPASASRRAHIARAACLRERSLNSMAEDTHVIRGINWRETFPFTNIFRSFRVAIHPSKLILALLAVLLLYLGGRVLDGLWPTAYRAVPGEIEAYEAMRSGHPMALEPLPMPLGALGRAVAAPERPRLAADLFDFGKARQDARAVIEAKYADLLVLFRVENADGKVITDAQEAKKAAE